MQHVAMVNPWLRAVAAPLRVAVKVRVRHRKFSAASVARLLRPPERCVPDTIPLRNRSSVPRLPAGAEFGCK